MAILSVELGLRFVLQGASYYITRELAELAELGEERGCGNR